MPTTDAHRKVTANREQSFSLEQPFSSFGFIESNFGDYDSIRRLFSLSRSFQAKTLIVEDIPPCGVITEENEDILRLFGNYENTGLFRLSFWKSDIIKNNALMNSDDLVGYAILKRDKTVDGEYWHVFESVIAKYPHHHNCVPRPRKYEITVRENTYHIKGVLYCQQNSLNKACAQVALRSLLSRILPSGGVSYRQINEIAASVSPGFVPSKGLTVPQFRAILETFELKYRDIDYTLLDAQTRDDLPYQKYAYAGLEAGSGALIGFRLAGRDLLEEAKHIIPVYGHTFNKDTWAPNADFSYFRIGEGFGYVPSECWTSSFLSHDDNFGPNFCIPRLYIEKDKVDYVVEIFRKGICYSGVQAEAMALNLLYSLLPQLKPSENIWILRLLQWVEKQQIVFRAVSLEAPEYTQHLSQIVDWEDNREDNAIYTYLEGEIPDYTWVIEISTPQLFPANERKLGEIVFDATKELDLQDDSSMNDVFILARLPESYFFGGEMVNETPQFTSISSQIKSHTELIKQ